MLVARVRRLCRGRPDMCVAELVSVRGQKSHDFCYGQNQIGLAKDRG